MEPTTYAPGHSASEGSGNQQEQIRYGSDSDSTDGEVGYQTSHSTPVNHETFRTPSGSSVIEPDSVMDADNQRLYHGYKEGKYFLPNDAVWYPV
jgi:hypothetical protein